MEFIKLLTMLVAIIFVSKIVAQMTKTVDILWYIIFGLIGTQYIFHIDSSLLKNWSTLGVIFIMFYAGWRENLLSFLIDIWKNKWVALIAAIGPFIGGYISYHFLGFEFHEAIVAGFIFTSTAVPYTIAVLTNTGLEKTRGAKAILASSVTDNFISIFMAVGVLPAFALLHLGEDSMNSFGSIFFALGEQMLLVLGAFLLFAVLGLFILPDARMHMRMNIPSIMQRDGILAKLSYFIYKVRKFPGLYEISKVFSNVRIGIPMTLLLIFGLAWVAYLLGLHPAISAYFTGLILHIEMYHETKKSQIIDDKTPINHKNLSIFFYFVQEWIGPIFFIYLGSQMIINWSEAGYVILLAAGAALGVGLFQYWSAYIAGRKTSKLPKHDAKLLGFGMLPCDVIAFVVLGLATSTGLINPDSLFVIVVIVSILILNIATTIFINWYKPKYLIAEEKYAKLQADLSH